MAKEGMPTPEEVQRELAEHIDKDAQKDPDFFKKHDARIKKEIPDNKEPAK